MKVCNCRPTPSWNPVGGRHHPGKHGPSGIAPADAIALEVRIRRPSHDDVQDGWCSEGKNKYHAGLNCYRSYGSTKGGQQCCYNDAGGLETDLAKGAGTVDRRAPASGERKKDGWLGKKGDCVNYWSSKHYRYDVMPYNDWGKEDYDEVHDCMRQHRIPSGDGGLNGNGVTDEELEEMYQHCKEDVGVK